MAANADDMSAQVLAFSEFLAIRKLSDKDQDISTEFQASLQCPATEGRREWESGKESDDGFWDSSLAPQSAPERVRALSS